MCGEESLLKVPHLTALKVTTLRLGNTRWCLAHFGNVLYKDTSASQEKQDTIEMLSGKYHLRKPPRNGWNGLTSMDDIVFAVRGLREVVEALLHPSVWNAFEKKQLLRLAEELYRTNSGQIDMSKLERFFVARVREHFQSVRGAILSGKPKAQRFEDLKAAKGESKKLWEQLRASTVQRCFIFRERYGGTGRAGSDLPISVRSGRPHIINAVGDWAPAPDDAKVEHISNAMPYERVRPDAAAKKRTPTEYHYEDKENRNNGGGGGNKRQKKDLSNSHCVRCGLIGHRYLRCERPWVSIPRGT